MEYATRDVQKGPALLESGNDPKQQTACTTQSCCGCSRHSGEGNSERHEEKSQGRNHTTSPTYWVCKTLCRYRQRLPITSLHSIQLACSIQYMYNGGPFLFSLQLDLPSQSWENGPRHSLGIPLYLELMALLMLVFKTSENLSKLADLDTINVDGTFATCPALYCQLFTINGLINGQQFPLVCSLLPTKSRVDQNRFFTIVIRCDQVLHAQRLDQKWNLFTFCQTRPNGIRQSGNAPSMHLISKVLWTHIKPMYPNILFRKLFGTCSCCFCQEWQ